MLGELQPDSGSIRLGTGLEGVYFDQLREQLDPEASVFSSIADGADWIDVGGNRKHVLSYLGDFLFSPDRARTPVRALSGGERNRLLLARLFTKSFNLLVLDEPTNDLDIETLDLLLMDFSGTLIVVSHDRAFLDNVVTSTLVFEGGGRVGGYVGGYADWVRQRKVAVAPAPPKKPATPPTTKPTNPQKKKKLSMKEAAELAGLPDRIDALERERVGVPRPLRPGGVRDGGAMAAARAKVTALESEIAAATSRWEELEEIGLSSRACVVIPSLARDLLSVRGVGEPREPRRGKGC